MSENLKDNEAKAADGEESDSEENQSGFVIQNIPLQTLDDGSEEEPKAKQASAEVGAKCWGKL